jgi:phospholipase C
MTSQAVGAARAAFSAAIACAVAAGCATARGPLPSGATQAGSSAAWTRVPRLPGQTGPIRHVVFVVQENRSFDELFQAYPGANTVASGSTSDGTVVPLQPIGLEAPFDLPHQFGNALLDMDAGRMDGFATEGRDCATCPKYPAYAYVPAAETTTYVAMAQRYVLADDFFPSPEDGSFVAHQYLIAAQADDTYALPVPGYWGCDAPQSTVGVLDPDTTPGTRTGERISPCFDPYETLADEIDATPPLTWRYYAAPHGNTGYFWSAFDAVKHIRDGPEWSTNVENNKRFFTDLQAGNLASVTWITPTFGQSDHPGSKNTHGPAWVASIVDALGASPFWASTAIFITWDDWGGWYDHVAPPVLDFDGLGIRTPLLVVSAYARTNTVAHTQYETGSLLAFTEQTFGLQPLAASDARANPLAGGDVFDFTRLPRAFKRP